MDATDDGIAIAQAGRVPCDDAPVVLAATHLLAARPDAPARAVEAIECEGPPARSAVQEDCAAAQIVGSRSASERFCATRDTLLLRVPRRISAGGSPLLRLFPAERFMRRNYSKDPCPRRVVAPRCSLNALSRPFPDSSRHAGTAPRTPPKYDPRLPEAQRRRWPVAPLRGCACALLRGGAILRWS